MISRVRKGHLTLISLLGKGLYQMTTKETNDIKREEGSGLGDVGNKVFADDDVVKEGDIVIKQFHPGKVRGGKINLGQISIYFWIHHTFLVISEKVGQTFLSTISQSLKDGSLLQHMKGIRR